jgi:hypothetical protein
MSVENGNNPQGQLTHSTLSNFPCHDPEKGNHFNHDIRHYARHSCGRWDAYVNFQPFEKVFYSNEEPDECSLASAETFGRLETWGSEYSHYKAIKKDRPREELQHLQILLLLEKIPVKYIYI